MSYTIQQIKAMSPEELAEANKKMQKKLLLMVLAFTAVKYLTYRMFSKLGH